MLPKEIFKKVIRSQIAMVSIICIWAFKNVKQPCLKAMLSHVIVLLVSKIMVCWPNCQLVLHRK